MTETERIASAIAASSTNREMATYAAAQGGLGRKALSMDALELAAELVGQGWTWAKVLRTNT